MAYRKKNRTEKIAALEQEAAQIKARIQRERARVREDERKRDTRRKIIAGALALEHKDPAFQEALRRLLNEYVTRPDERGLFDLPPLPEGTGKGEGDDLERNPAWIQGEQAGNGPA